jgi:hypothetical protein
MGLLSDLQSEIEKRRLPSGGWASGQGRRAAIETTCYGLIALADGQQSVRQNAIDFLLRTKNPDQSWPAFEGDDPEGCWVTSLSLIALRFVHAPSLPTENSIQWLLDNKGREGHWLWKWKFRTVDRQVQFDPWKYGWSWFPGTVSWVIPTAFSLIALKQSLACCRTEQVADRIQLGMEMLRDRACPGGGWNAGNGMVFSAPLKPHIDTTAIALLALTEDDGKPTARRALDWLRQACVECSSAYSLAWSSLALLVHRDPAVDLCIERLHRVLYSERSTLNIETLSLAAIGINAAEGNANPFQVLV